MRVRAIAPSRISLFGGGTDLDIYSREHGGVVLSFAIDTYSTTTLFTEMDQFGVKENIFPYKSDPKFYYNVLDHYSLNGLHHSRHENSFDGRIESGLGSSASAIVAMLGAINKSFDKKIDNIPETAYLIENKTHFTGRQDHYASYYGGINVMEFKDGVTVTPLAHNFLDGVLFNLVLLHTNIERKKVAKEPKLTRKSKDALDKMKEIAVASIDVIGNGDGRSLGELLELSWNLKRESASSPEIDAIYDWAMKNDAIGGKLLGSGGGGYMIFVVKDKKDFTKKAKEKNLIPVDFNIDFNGLRVKEL